MAKPKPDEFRMTCYELSSSSNENEVSDTSRIDIEQLHMSLNSSVHAVLMKAKWSLK